MDRVRSSMPSESRPRTRGEWDKYYENLSNELGKRKRVRNEVDFNRRKSDDVVYSGAETTRTDDDDDIEFLGADMYDNDAETTRTDDDDDDDSEFLGADMYDNDVETTETDDDDSEFLGAHMSDNDVEYSSAETNNEDSVELLGALKRSGDDGVEFLSKQSDQNRFSSESRRESRSGSRDGVEFLGKQFDQNSFSSKTRRESGSRDDGVEFLVKRFDQNSFSTNTHRESLSGLRVDNSDEVVSHFTKRSRNTTVGANSGRKSENGELEKDNECEAGDNENLKEGAEENLSNVVEDMRTVCSHRKITRVNKNKKSFTEQEDDDESDCGKKKFRAARKDDEYEAGDNENNLSNVVEDTATRCTRRKSARINTNKESNPGQEEDDESNCGKKKSRAAARNVGSARDVDLMKILAESINSLKEQQSIVEENALAQETLQHKFRFEDEVLPPYVKSEWENHIDSLFADLELGLRQSELDCTNSSAMENEEQNSTEINETPAARCGRGVHQPILDEEIGLVCEHCLAVILDIKYVLPPFCTSLNERRDRKNSDESASSFIDQIQLEGSSFKTPNSTNCAKGTVWDLIPGVEKEMYPHQREGFEFIWKNIAGDIFIEKLKQHDSDGRGCIISHAPGTGKTRLTIVFLQTFLKLYPTCCPAIIAPRGMLLTWESEFIKWNANIPFHNMNKNELSGIEKTVATKFFGQVGGRTFSLDCIRRVKLYCWMRGGSILGISYNLFEKLAGANVRGGHHAQMREVLLKRPGLLVLDEGHTPRNDQSLIWQTLSKVATQRRIILSGTPFQNNVIELFNTLCVVNPKFVSQIWPGNNNTRQNDSVARKRWATLTGSIGKTKDDGLKKLRAMLDPFVHVHNGTILQESLPGLRHALVFLRPTQWQKTLLETCSKEPNIFHRIRLVSLVSVHPSLKEEMNSCPVRKSKLQEIKSDVDAGVKIKFLMKLIWLADALGERVLVFSQYIDPLAFIKKQIKSNFSWNEGRELLYMDGNLDVKQRQDSISSFNDDTSEAKVLLASERACSEGINLVGASRVVLLDTVWNPSVEKQAISRAYRLGQKKVVYVYRLFTTGFEVRQYAQQIEKERIAQLIFSPGHGDCCQSEKSPIVLEDKVLETMLHIEKFSDIFEKIIYEPKESDLFEIFGLNEQN